MSNCPVKQPSYADDFNITHSARKIPELERLLQRDVDAFVTWARSKKLAIAPSKTKITLFTPDKSRESKAFPKVYIDGNLIELNKNPRFLGVHFDTHFHFHKHAEEVAKSCRSKLNTLRMLSNTAWGCSKETILKTYKTYIIPALCYAAPVWSPNVSDSSIEDLQKIQNSALRIATGCHMATTIEDLHLEAEFMPVADRLCMLSDQYLLSCSRPSHPSNAVVSLPIGPRGDKKKTLQFVHSSHIAPLLVNGVADPSTYGRDLKKIHTDSVAATISKLGNNSVLEARPPRISPSEKTLPRIQRTTLAQLRNGQCKRLKDFQHTKFTPPRAPDALCPECLSRRHSSTHVFDCDAVPTDIPFRDLWDNPIRAVDFLKTLPSFTCLLPLDPPPPPPPPEPPP